ncbi:MAG: four helix bundle protein [Bryobacterales bacterium]|nr:four helix bundle protein [Bryobacterales bacterium]
MAAAPAPPGGMPQWSVSRAPRLAGFQPAKSENLSRRSPAVSGRWSALSRIDSQRTERERAWHGAAQRQFYGLTTQLRRSSASVPANLAEGRGRNGDAEFARFCSIARGPASELEYHLLMARDLKLIPLKDYEELTRRATEVKRMLTALLQKLNVER